MRNDYNDREGYDNQHDNDHYGSNNGQPTIKNNEFPFRMIAFNILLTVLKFATQILFTVHVIDM